VRETIPQSLWVGNFALALLSYQSSADLGHRFSGIDTTVAAGKQAWNTGAAEKKQNNFL
jgi:NhaP-type Na+/H+ or K+/H+ antiporter